MSSIGGPGGIGGPKGPSGPDGPDGPDDVGDVGDMGVDAARAARAAGELEAMASEIAAGKLKLSAELYDFSDFDDEVATHLGLVGAF